MNDLKEQGNSAFKQSKFQLAVQYYTQAIERISPELEKLKLDSKIDSSNTENLIQFKQLIKSNDCLHKCLNNRSQCHLKLGNYQDAADDATKVLLAIPDDTKALYRRSLALKELNLLDESLRDVKRSLNIEPKNKDCINLIQSLSKLFQDKTNEQKSTKTQVAKMFELAKTGTGDNRLNSLNNLIVLSREDSGCNEILSINGIQNLIEIKNCDSSEEVTLSITRILASLCKNSFARAKIVFNQLQAELIASLISHQKETISTAASLIVQNMIYSLTDLENKRKTKKQINQSYEFTQEVQEYIDEIFRNVIMLIMEPKCSGYGRDNCIDLCLKFVDRAQGCGWTSRFIVFGVPKLLRVAATIPELNLANSLPLTEHTKMHVSCCLSAVYDDIFTDSERETYQETVNKFIKDLCERHDNHSKLKAIACIGVILQGPFDVGNNVIMQHNLLNLMLDLADSDDPIQEKIAVEAVVYSASKKDKATGILSEGIDILKKLYNSKNNSIKLLADGSTQKLEQACRKILCSSLDLDSKKWASDGLAYLSLDADVKHILVQDHSSIRALFELANSDDKNILFSIASILANVTNANAAKKPSEEMIKLAEYAKHHIPEENEKDKEIYYKKRRQVLMDLGVGNALSQMAKHNSDSCRELIASVYLVLAEETLNRGKLVAAGAGKALIPLASSATDLGRTRAAQALAKIAISINPELAFPGQRVLEVVRPLIKLLHPEKTALENFESLMALTNLAGVNDSVRKRIVKEQGISNIEHYVFDEHQDLRRAATECLCNMAQNEDVLFVYEKPDNDRIKLLVLYCGEEDDIKLNLAASGALAQLSENSEKICQRILEVKSFLPIFKQAACVADVEFQFRIFYILDNVVSKNKDFLTQIVNSELMDVIVALSKLDVEKERVKVKNLACEIVKRALENKLIKPTVASFMTENDSD
ncbi:hypothetical protein BpHYR1_001189 [Brachionus plicatilis]|uniref:UNC-45/Cro1/She4 central domain-containing protein n=1 Tax=Brachionus plicatilis TaxID=10195 RepID=A0A3M7PAE0_BRAPC|nr:hypothetical protein BpHYR1_001189 [Brachionus plicatilis]